MVEFVEPDRKPFSKIYKLGKYSFSQTEIKHFVIAFILISLTLYVVRIDSLFSGTSIFDVIYKILLIPFKSEFLVFILVFALAFILHELGHKLVAQNYGFISEFRADFTMLFLSFILALLSPFVFLAPGAVMILGQVSLRQNGIISVAGPLINLIQAVIYAVIFFIFFPNPSSLFAYFLKIGVWINSFLGIFNMLPFWVLDGKKVLQWSPPIYFLVLAGLVFMFFLSFKIF